MQFATETFSEATAPIGVAASNMLLISKSLIGGFFMKSIFLSLMIVFFAAVSNASETNLVCFGTGEYKGSTATATLTTSGELEFVGTTVMRNRRDPIQCSARLDAKYSPKTASPRFDRFLVDGTSCGDFVFVSKDLEASGKGYVNFVDEHCGHPGDACEVGFFCKSN